MPSAITLVYLDNLHIVKAVSGLVQCMTYIKLPIAQAYLIWAIDLLVFSVNLKEISYGVFGSLIFKWLNLFKTFSI
jgi:hypothetical protein